MLKEAPMGARVSRSLYASFISGVPSSPELTARPVGSIPRTMTTASSIARRRRGSNFFIFFPPLVLPGRTVGFKRKAQNPPEKHPGFVHYIQCRPGAIVYFWHFAVRKETEKFPLVESVVFMQILCSHIQKRRGGLVVFSFRAGPKIFYKNRKKPLTNSASVL